MSSRNPCLTAEQSAAVTGIFEIIENSSFCGMTLAGVAGTGKTTCIKAIVDRCAATYRPCVVAPTGKAAFVLCNKGVPARTVHAAIYHCVRDDHGFVKFLLDNRAETWDTVDLLICDEASMVNTALHEDITTICRTHEIPLLYVGDPCQLEPIGQDPRLLDDPDFLLAEIHRQALASPIIRFAHAERVGDIFGESKDQTGLKIVPQQAAPEHATAADCVICGFNDTRQLYNETFREIHDFSGVLQPGEQIICLRNNREHGIYNGMSAKVLRIISETDRIIVVDIALDNGARLVCVPLLKEQFGAPAIPFGKEPAWAATGGPYTLWDYGYCITAHKAQGSEWDNVLVIEETSSGWNEHRWRYTAITRAAKRLVYATDRF
jgi:exodeoxyribonuclease-5